MKDIKSQTITGEDVYNIAVFLLKEIMKEDAIHEWLMMKNSAFNNKRPVDNLGGIFEMVMQMRSGVVS